MIDISILIVCYRSIDLIGPTLSGLFEFTDGCTYEVLLTDCSDDGTEAWVAEHYPQVKILPAGGNLGFAAGNNFLSQHASGEYLLLLNPDVIVDDNAIGSLFQCAKHHSDAGAWGGQTRLPDGTVDPGSQQSTPTLKRLALAAMGQEKRTVGGLSKDATGPESVEGLSGAFLMVRRQTWEALGGFDESFFMYAEELDLCYRIRQSGQQLLMTPDSRITHLVGGGSALNPRRATSIAKAKMHFLRKHRGKFYAMLAAILYWFAAANRVALGLVLGKILGRQRPGQLMAAHLPVLMNPASWVTGYKENPSATGEIGPAAGPKMA